MSEQRPTHARAADDHGPPLKRQPLSREAIISTALSIIDHDGLDALTMRRLGRELHVDPMAIYYHVPNKAALFDGVVELIYDEIDLEPVALATPWPDQLAAAMRSFRAALRRHPNAISIVGTRPANTPRMIEIIETGIALLAAAGIPVQDALDALNCLTVFTIGHALAEVGQPVGGASTDNQSDFESRTARLAASPLASYEYAPDTEYELGLGAMLDGLSARLTTEPDQADPRRPSVPPSTARSRKESR